MGAGLLELEESAALLHLAAVSSRHEPNSRIVSINAITMQCNENQNSEELSSVTGHETIHSVASYESLNLNKELQAALCTTN